MSTIPCEMGTQETPRYLSARDVGRIAGLSERTIHRCEERGTLIPHHRTPGGFRRYLPEDVERFVASLRTAGCDV